MKQLQWLKALNFNKQEIAYARQYIKDNSRLMIVTLIIIALIASGMIIPSVLVYYGYSMFGFGGLGYEGSGAELVIFCICILAYFVPVYQFRFMMKRSSSDLYLSLPIQRSRLFHVQYMLGALFLLLAGLLSVGVFYLSHGIMPWDEVVWSAAVFVVLITLGLALYTFFSMLVVKSRTALDAMIICMIYTLLPLILFMALNAFYQDIISEVLLSNVYGDEVTFLQQIATHVSSLLSVPLLMFEAIALGNDLLFDISIVFLAFYVLVWVFFALGCYSWGKKAFISFKSEESGQKSRSWMTYPAILPALAFVLILAFGKGELISFNILFILVVYVILNFFADRSIHLDWRVFAIYAGIVIGVSLCFQSAVSTNLYGTLYEIPEVSQIQDIEVHASYIRTQENGEVESERRWQSIFHQADQRTEMIIAGHKSLLQYVERDWQFSISSGGITVMYTVGNEHDDTTKEVYRTYRFSDKAGCDALLRQLEAWKQQGIVTEVTERSDGEVK